jgi:hypothetical protein
MTYRILSSAVILLAVGRASALVLLFDNEQHGREPYKAGVDGAWKHIMAILNSPGREYWRDKGSSGFGNDHHEITAAYRGDAGDLNQILRTLAHLPATFKAEVVFLPGAGAIVDKTGKRISCDWRARLTYNHAFDFPNRDVNQPSETLVVRLEVFIPEWPAPAPPATDKQVAAWIKDLNDKKFAVREKAEHELSRQGPAIRTAIRDALAAKPSAETICRLERILAQLSRLHVADIQKPRGLAMSSFDMLVERARKSLVHKEPASRWHASQRLHEAIEFNDELQRVLTAVLDDEELTALKKQTQNAPKDYLTGFKPLLDAKPISASTRAELAAMYRDLRGRLDQFCR